MDKPIAYIINESVAEAVECTIVNQQSDFVIAEGILQQGEKLNRNKRIYSTEDLHREIYGPRLRELITTGNFKGEAGHPTCMDLARQQKVDPTLEQVWYTKVWMEGPYVKAQFRGTNNDLGRAFNQDLKDGQKPSFSLRSLGSINRADGQNRVVNLRIICYDRVYFPSYDNAYTDHVLSESAAFGANNLFDYIRSNGNEQVVKEDFELLAPIVNDTIIDELLKESSNLNSLCEDFKPKKITCTGDTVTMITEDYDTVIMPVDKYIKKSIDDFCKDNF